MCASGHDRARWCESAVPLGRLKDPRRASQQRLLLPSRVTFAQRDEAQQQDPRLQPGASCFLGARACDRAASRSGALPWPAGSEEPAVAGLFDLIKCPLELRCLVELAAGAPAAARGKRLKTPPRKRGRSDGRWVCEQSRGALRAAPSRPLFSMLKFE